LAIAGSRVCDLVIHKRKNQIVKSAIASGIAGLLKAGAPIVG
jgi:hypothetical protein